MPKLLTGVLHFMRDHGITNPEPELTSPAQDLDGDGRAEDTNGNGRLDFADIVTLFEHMASAEVQGNQADFDFNGNGSFDMDDIVQLFALVTA